MEMQSNISSDELMWLYKSMYTIRAVESRLSVDFKAGKLPGPVHLYIGQEAVATGVCANLNDRDWITSTHRGHGHFIAKGGELDSFFGEIHGRSTGICGGKGGSMHVADVSKGILGANGIVAAGIGLATGAAWAEQSKGTNNVAVAFFGDGASNQGVLAESLNIAALWKLPLILVCENNGFSEFSLARDVTSGKLHRRAEAFDVPAEEVDGNDVLAVWNVAARAIERARNGEGPTFIEAKTYRYHGHTESESNFVSRPYRTDEEIEQWRKKDPIDLFAERLIGGGRFDADALNAVRAEIDAAVDSSVLQAENAPWPAIDQAFTNMYA